MSVKSFVAPGLNAGSRFSKPPVSAEEGKQKESIGETGPAWMIAAAERIAQGEEGKKRSANLGRQQLPLESLVGRDDKQEPERKNFNAPSFTLRNGPPATATTTKTTQLAAEAKDAAPSAHGAVAGGHSNGMQPVWMAVAAEQLAQEEEKENEIKMKADLSQQRRRITGEPMNKAMKAPAPAVLKVGPPSLTLLKPSLAKESDEKNVITESLLAQRKSVACFLRRQLERRQQQ